LAKAFECQSFKNLQQQQLEEQNQEQEHEDDDDDKNKEEIQGQKLPAHQHVQMVASAQKSNHSENEHLRRTNIAQPVYVPVSLKTIFVILNLTCVQQICQLKHWMSWELWHK